MSTEIVIALALITPLIAAIGIFLSTNTPNLRELQEKEPLTKLINSLLKLYLFHFLYTKKNNSKFERQVNRRLRRSQFIYIVFQ